MSKNFQYLCKVGLVRSVYDLSVFKSIYSLWVFSLLVKMIKKFCFKFLEVVYWFLYLSYDM